MQQPLRVMGGIFAFIRLAMEESTQQAVTLYVFDGNIARTYRLGVSTSVPTAFNPATVQVPFSVPSGSIR